MVDGETEGARASSSRQVQTLSVRIWPASPSRALGALASLCVFLGASSSRAEQSKPKAPEPWSDVPVGLTAPPAPPPRTKEGLAREVATCLALGRAAVEAGALTAALPVLRRAVTLAPKDAVAWTLLGRVLTREGRRLDEAKGALERAAALAPEDAEPAYRLGLVLEQQGQSALALKQYAMAAAHAPDRADVRLALGRCARTGGQRKVARSAFEALLRLEPKSAIARTNLAALYEHAADHTRAEAMLRALTKDEPNEWLYWEQLGRFLERRGRQQEADDAFDEVRKRNPQRVLPARKYRPLR